MTMRAFDHHEGAYNEMQQMFEAPGGYHHHQAKLSHELIAAAASYEAAKMYNEHVAKNGVPPSHAQAKQIMAAAAGFFIDRMIETKGLDFIDRQKAKRHAEEHVETYFTEETYNTHRHGHHPQQHHYVEEEYEDTYNTHRHGHHPQEHHFVEEEYDSDSSRHRDRHNRHHEHHDRHHHRD